MKWIITFLFCISCASDSLDIRELKNAKNYWVILDQAVKEEWTKKHLYQRLGKPDQREKKESGQEAWIFHHSKTDSQEWIFEFSMKGKLQRATYFPISDNFPEFSLDEIKDHWESFDCSYKEKKELEIETSLKEKIYSCDHGKKNVVLDENKEVISVTVKK